MKVYLVYETNNEMWEDYEEYVVGVFATREAAIGAIEAAGFSPHISNNEWEKKYWGGRFDSKNDESGHNYSRWIEEEEVHE